MQAWEQLRLVAERVIVGPGYWPIFKAVDDRVRGGSSVSHMVLPTKPLPELPALFTGHLDIETLGGAGFASQSTSFEPPLALPPKHYSHLALRVLLPPSPPADSTPTVFVITLKNEVPSHRPDGRRESVVNYESEFDLRDLRDLVEHKVARQRHWIDVEKLVGEIDEEDRQVELNIEWEDFKPVYRGRPAEDAPPLDPTDIHELSFMCRSNFGKQQGDFSLSILSLSAVHTQDPSSFMYRIKTLFVSWWTWWTNLLKRGAGYGYVKLG